MSVDSSHEMSHVNYLISYGYTNASCDPWWRDHNLLVDVPFISKSPKVVVSYSRNVSKLFKSDDCHSSNDAN
jgi:hypothetical protein